MEKELTYEQKKVREILNSSDRKIQRFDSRFYVSSLEQKVNKIINYTSMRMDN